MTRPVQSSAFRGAPGQGARTALELRWSPIASIAPGDWRELASRAIEPNVFLEPAFAGAAAAHLAGGTIRAVEVRAGGRLLGLLPGRVEGVAAARPAATFVAWTHLYAPLSTPLVDREAAPHVVAALLEYLPQLPGAPQLALLPLLTEEGPVARLLAAHLGRSGRSAHRLDAHRRAALETGAGGTAFSPKKLRERRRQRRLLREQGALTHDAAVEPPAIAAALKEFLEVEAAGWKGRSGSAARLDPAAARFATDAVSALAEEGKVRIDLLRLDGRTIAAAIALFSGDRGWFWKTGYDERFARFSPGVQVALDLTEALGARRGLALVDSCAVPDHPMIDHMWNGRLAIADWLLPLGGQAAFAAGIAVERARRAAVASLKALRGAAGR